MVLHWRLHENRDSRFKVSHLCYATHPYIQYQITVKLLGSFRLAAGRRHLHRPCIFTKQIPETVPNSLYHSCASELHLSLIVFLCAYRETSFPVLLRALDYIFFSRELSNVSSGRFRLPEPFIVYASRMILRNVSFFRCSSLFIFRQISANCRKSFCFADLRGNLTKCGMTFLRRSSSFLTSYLSVLSPQSRRMCPQPKYSCIKYKTSRRSKF